MKKFMVFAPVLAFALGAAGALVELEFYTPDVVRVLKVPEGGVKPKSFAVLAKPGAVDVKKSREREVETYETSRLKVSVDGEGRVSFRTAAGEMLLEEAGGFSRPRPALDPDEGRFTVRQDWRLAEGEKVYGLGIWQEERIERNGMRRHMIQANVEDYVPVVQSVKGWGIFWDNASPTDFEEKGGVIAFESEVADAEDYYFMYGGSSDAVVGQMRFLTGAVPMQPKWTLGYYISRERYVSWAEDIAIVDEHRRRGIPLDAIVQDWQYWGSDANWNAMDFTIAPFVEPEKNIAALHDRNVKVMITIWPGFGPETAQYKAFKEKGLYFKGGFDTWPRNRGVIVYDAFSKEARDMYWGFLAKLRGAGIDAWWMDSTEPDHYTFTKESFDAPTALGSYRRVVNAFPLFTVGGVYDHQRAEETDGRRRVSIMTRSVWAGQQRTGANTWSGDVVASWEALRKQIPAGLGFGLTGNPNFNTDIGGFFTWKFDRHPAGGGACKNPEYVELTVRWMQYGLFNPIFRSHGTGTPREIWQFGEKGSPAYEAMNSCIKLRYRLMPYLYSTAWWVSSANGTMMRPLFAEYAADPETHTIADQFLFGTQLMAAPVVHKGAENRRLYLPEGVWYDFFTGEKTSGGRWIERPVKLDTIPLYAKAGAIVPLGPDVQFTGEIANPVVDINVFPGADGSFTLYDDAGDGYGYEQGQFSEIPLEWCDKSQTLKIGARRGSYPGMAAKRIFRVHLPSGAIRTVEYDGAAVETR